LTDGEDRRPPSLRSSFALTLEGNVEKKDEREGGSTGRHGVLIGEESSRKEEGCGWKRDRVEREREPTRVEGEAR
jgi:hypothetical protein